MTRSAIFARATSAPPAPPEAVAAPPSPARIAASVRVPAAFQIARGRLNKVRARREELRRQAAELRARATDGPGRPRDDLDQVMSLMADRDALAPEYEAASRAYLEAKPIYAAMVVEALAPCRREAARRLAAALAEAETAWAVLDQADAAATAAGAEPPALVPVEWSRLQLRAERWER